MINKEKQEILKLIQEQLILIKNPIIKSEIEKILIEPIFHKREWDYSDNNESFDCWTIAIDEKSDTSIIFSNYGYGPKNPWGLVFTSKLWFGMDSGWYDELEKCFLESFFSSDIPIWCIEKKSENELCEIVESNLTFDTAYKIRDELASLDKKMKYNVIPSK